MGFSYYDYYTTPIISYVNYGIIMAIAVLAAVILGLVMFFVFLRKSNEGRFAGFRKTMYNLLTFNRFYAEDIIKFIYVIAACIATVAGIVMIILGSFVIGIIMLVAVNIILRISAELVMMFIILCKKTVSVDRRLASIENFYSENYGEDWGAAGIDEESEEDGCGSCGGCDIAEELSEFKINAYEEKEEEDN